jgi:hypothetical protein
MSKKNKAEAVIELLKAGIPVKRIKARIAVSESYIYMLKKQLAEGVEEAVETVRQTAAEHNKKVKEMIEGWRAEAEEDWRAEADTDVDAILNERGSNYGSFENVAKTAQSIKDVLYTTTDLPLMCPDQREALDMITSKIARIVNGDPDYVDSWIDIAGYATLVADRLQGKTR